MDRKIGWGYTPSVPKADKGLFGGVGKGPLVESLHPLLPGASQGFASSVVCRVQILSIAIGHVDGLVLAVDPGCNRHSSSRGNGQRVGIFADFLQGRMDKNLVRTITHKHARNTVNRTIKATSNPSTIESQCVFIALAQEKRTCRTVGMLGSLLEKANVW